MRNTLPATLQVTLSVVEIYLERIKDLLDPGKDNLQARQQKGVGQRGKGGAGLHGYAPLGWF